MTEEHEEREKPFDPERRGSWRGGQRELVLNPADFQENLRELVLEASRLTTAELEEAQAILKKGGRPDKVMRELDRVLEMHGVEAIPHSGNDTKYLYLNAGDTYNSTLIYSYDEDKYFVSDIGTVIEEYTPEAEREAWDDWLERDVKREVKREIEGQSSLSEEATEALVEKFDERDSDELWFEFVEAVREAGGEFVHESDGSVFVSGQKKAVEKMASDALDGGSTPNPRRVKSNADKTIAAMSQSEFVEAVVKTTPEGRPFRWSSGAMSNGRYDALYLNFYNIPDGLKRDPAELENNRMMFRIDGWDRASPDTQVHGNVKIEQMVSALPRDYRLRGKTGKPAAIAAYLAAFLTKVATEVPPKYTHSRAPNRR